MGVNNSVDGPEYNKIIRDVYNHKPEKAKVKELGAIIIKLDGVAKAQKVKRLLVEAGSAKLCEDLNHYINKLEFRELQFKQMKKLVDKVIMAARKAGKTIPKSKKCARKSYLKYIKKMIHYRYLLLEYVPAKEGE